MKFTEMKDSNLKRIIERELRSLVNDLEDELGVYKGYIIHVNVIERRIADVMKKRGITPRS